MIHLATPVIVAEMHTFTSTSSSRGNLIVNRAACSCGYQLDWWAREQQHRRHVLAEVFEAGYEAGWKAAGGGAR